MIRRAADAFYVYRFMRMLTQSWSDTDAHKRGVVDVNGDKTGVGKLTLFERLVFNLRRLIQRVPGGRSQAAGLAAAAWLLKEQANVDLGLDTDWEPTEFSEGDRVVIEFGVAVDTAEFVENASGVVTASTGSVLFVETASGAVVAQNASSNVSANVSVPDAPIGTVLRRTKKRVHKRVAT